MTDEIHMESEALMTGSVLTPSTDSQDIVPTTDEFDGLFQSRIEDLLGLPGGLF